LVIEAEAFLDLVVYQHVVENNEPCALKVSRPTAAVSPHRVHTCRSRRPEKIASAFRGLETRNSRSLIKQYVIAAFVGATLLSLSVHAQKTEISADNLYAGMWVTEYGNVRHELLPNGRYIEARGGSPNRPARSVIQAALQRQRC
jgi:hypothetical protein